MKSKIFKYLYGLLVLVPALAVFSTCAYVSLNENAKDSIDSTTSVYNVTSTSQLVKGNTYTIYSGTNFSATNISVLYSFSSITDSSFDLPTTFDYDAIMIYGNTSQWRYYYYFGGNNVGETDWIRSGSTYFTFVFDSFTDPYNRNSLGGFTQSYYVTEYKLDNAFYHSMEVVENHQLFSWVKGNFLYDGMNNFADIFNAKDTFLSFYFAYVLTMSLIYLAFEVLMLFINMARNLINAIQRKEW